MLSIRADRPLGLLVGHGKVHGPPTIGDFNVVHPYYLQRQNANDIDWLTIDNNVEEQPDICCSYRNPGKILKDHLHHRQANVIIECHCPIHYSIDVIFEFMQNMATLLKCGGCLIMPHVVYSLICLHDPIYGKDSSVIGGSYYSTRSGPTLEYEEHVVATWLSHLVKDGSDRAIIGPTVAPEFAYIVYFANLLASGAGFANVVFDTAIPSQITFVK